MEVVRKSTYVISRVPKKRTEKNDVGVWFYMLIFILLIYNFALLNAL